MIHSLILVTGNFIGQALKKYSSYIIYFLLPPAGFTMMVLMIRISDQPNGELQGLNFLLFFIFLQAGFISSLVLKDREEGVEIRILTAPLRKIIYSLGNSLAALSILMMQTLITLGLICLFMPDIGMELFPRLLGLFFICSLSAVSMGALLTALSRDRIQGALIHNIVIYLTSILGGCFFPKQYMSPVMQKIAWFFPQNWGVEAINAIYFEQWRLLPSRMMLLLIFSLFFLVVQVFIRQQQSRNSKI